MMAWLCSWPLLAANPPRMECHLACCALVCTLLGMYGSFAICPMLWRSAIFFCQVHKELAQTVPMHLVCFGISWVKRWDPFCASQRLHAVHLESSGSILLQLAGDVYRRRLCGHHRFWKKNGNQICSSCEIACVASYSGTIGLGCPASHPLSLHSAPRWGLVDQSCP